MALGRRVKSQQAVQLRLFGEEKEKAGRKEKGTTFNDPAFASNKSLPIHRWVPWIAGFSRDFVGDAMVRYLPERGTVLDPFSGVGTTLVEAILLGHEAIGFEINPYAALACRTKIEAYQISVQALADEMGRFECFYQQHVSSEYQPTSQAPKGFKTRSAFYSPKVLRKVLIVQDFISMIDKTKDTQAVEGLFKLAFASTMVSYSNYSYEPSLGRRVSAGKKEIHDFPVGQTILNKLGQMKTDIAWFQEHLPNKQVRARVENTSFFDYRSRLEPDSVDLIITSPPYLNNYHYNRNTRPHLYWLAYAKRPKDLKPLEEANFGKYWQNVRHQKQLKLEFPLPNSDLAERLAHLRTLNPQKGIYGGNGWANYAAAYFNDCYKFAQGMNYALRAGGTALVVIGNSILQGVMMPTDRYLGQIAESVGLEVVGIEIPRATRVGNSIIQSEVRVGKAKKSHQLYEAVVEIRKKSSRQIL